MSFPRVPSAAPEPYWIWNGVLRSENEEDAREREYEMSAAYERADILTRRVVKRYAILSTARRSSTAACCSC